MPTRTVRTADGRALAVGEGGGPHALACAALCDERLVAAASPAGVAPRDADGHLTLIENRVPEVHEWLVRQF